MSIHILLFAAAAAQILTFTNPALSFTPVTNNHAYSSKMGTSFLSRQALPIQIRFNPNRNCNNFLTMKVSKGKSKQARSKGSQIALVNEARMRSAGRKGTKNFVDPNKVFVGNLCYNATESHLRKFLVEIGGVQETNIEAVKIIRDWKTGKSKGYGFIQFMAPIHATSALELIKGRKLLGRVVRLDQGKKKSKDPLVVVKNKRITPIDLEDVVIANALNHVESGAEREYEKMDKDDQQQVLDDGLFLDQFDDSVLFEGDDEEDDDFQFDGIYKEEFLSYDNGEENAGPMNREQRRDAAKKNKKRRKPGKGFGNIIPSSTQ